MTEQRYYDLTLMDTNDLLEEAKKRGLKVDILYREPMAARIMAYDAFQMGIHQGKLEYLAKMPRKKYVLESDRGTEYFLELTADQVALINYFGKHNLRPLYSTFKEVEERTFEAP